jgi:hypothetical protein
MRDEEMLKLLVRLLTEHLEIQNRITAGLLEAIEILSRQQKEKPPEGGSKS